MQQDFLLLVTYFLLTFTLPDELRKLARSNQKLIYNLLFRASAEATQQLAENPRFVGGQIGMIGVLQTWTRDLIYHSHVHYLVPGGGMSSDGKEWLSSNEAFLVPVRVLSILFRARFCDALRKTGLFDQVPARFGTRIGSFTVNQWEMAQPLSSILPMNSFGAFFSMSCPKVL